VADSSLKWRKTILAEHMLIAEVVRDRDSNRTLDAIKVHLAGTERAFGFIVD
jgi:DNA-binding FadR family transcriptional regulator